ncbi:hypothetical protein HaLaN_19053 [Haematococcus lacustris]|uniref:Uncharacterized protein n=1 Tax=Haematococcus lacustris TaxID=44745 RepID=A0A699ZSH7_HAELA|nr:hypothetical protein HaLaN_19053 [Haematococcus lacustris]
MRFEVDGTMQPKQSQVELRVYNRGRQKAARVWGHGAYDLLKAGGPRRAGGCAVQLPAPQQLCAGPGPARQQPSTC